MNIHSFTTEKIYSIEELYDSNDYLINDNNSYLIHKSCIFFNTIYNNYKEPLDLFEIMPKISNRDDYEESSDSENIYLTKKKPNDIINNNNSPLVDNNFSGIQELTVTGSKKPTNEISLINSVKVDEKTNNNKKRRYNTKNMGRKKKGDNLNYDNENKKIHNKMKPDNMRLKFKRGFINFLIDFINKLINGSSKLKRKRKIKKLKSIFVNTIKKDLNLKMLDLTAGEFLSREICEKCKKIDKDHNKKVINYIYSVNDTNIIEVLNKSIRELMIIFCSDKKEDNIFKYFKRLNNYVQDILIGKKNENELYITEFIHHAKNFEEEYKKIDGRKENK